MKKICFLLMLPFISSVSVHAQKPSVPGNEDRKKIQEFTIQLRPAPANTVLFDIVRQGRPVFNQPMNPVTMLPKGFQTKEDAFKVAEWMITQYGRLEHFPPMVPPHVAQQLNIKNLLPIPKPGNL